MEHEGQTVRPVLAFFWLTFAITWALWGAAAHLLGKVGEFWFLPGTIMPSLVALWLTARAEGRPGVRALLARIFDAPAAARWYLFAIGYFVAIKLVVAVIHRAALGAWPRFGELPWYLIAGAILISTPVQAGEEIGWRGYALPRLAQRLGLGPASVLLGMIWAAWHLPLFFIAGTDTFGQSFALYLVQVTALSVAMAWMFGHTNGGLLLMMLMHSAINQTSGIVPSATTVATPAVFLGGSLVGWLSALLLWIGAGFFLARMPRASARPARSSP